MNTTRAEQVFFACCLSLVGLGVAGRIVLRWFDRSVNKAVTSRSGIR